MVGTGGLGAAAIGIGPAAGSGLSPPGAGAITPGGVNTGLGPGIGIGFMTAGPPPSGLAASGTVMRMVSELVGAASAGLGITEAVGIGGLGAAIGIGPGTGGLGGAGIMGFRPGAAMGAGLMAVGCGAIGLSASEAASGTVIRIVWERVSPLTSGCAEASAGAGGGVGAALGAGIGLSNTFFRKSSFGGSMLPLSCVSSAITQLHFF